MEPSKILQDAGDEKGSNKTRYPGAMSRRLSAMTEQSLLQTARGKPQAIEEAGFSEELRRSLEERISASTFKSSHASAIALSEAPSGASKEIRVVAASPAWEGTETKEDAVLRMLVDTHRPPKVARPSPPKQSAPGTVGPPRPGSSGHRLANARDRSSIYALSQDSNLTEKEREQMRRDLRERFTPGARPMPGTIQGLASLANERIEDAIARGQFKNLPRGKRIDRDYNASSPFLDTTEYFMNKIIQKQDIVPPWIEKQQDLVRAATVFRGRLRADWKRHAARTIASRGGSLEHQVQRAESYAAAERLLAKQRSCASLSDGIRMESAAIGDQETEADGAVDKSSGHQPGPGSNTPSQPPPFRDPVWEAAERSYHALAITELNNLTRSYNLMAPDLAKKPYFSLDRELRNCFAEVAPQLADEIRERAKARPMAMQAVGHRPGSILEKFGGTERAKVYDERRPQYGFREFWRDLWS